MKTVSKMALATSLALTGLTGVALQPAAAKKEEKVVSPHLSKPVQAALVDAQTALGKGDTATADAKAAEAAAAAATPEDHFYVAQIQYQSAVKSNNAAAQTSALDAMIDSGAAPPDFLPQLLRIRAERAYQARDFNKAADLLGRLVETTPNDPEVLIMLAEAQFQTNRASLGLATAEKAIAAKKTSGAAVDQNWYARPLEVAYEAKMVPDELHWSGMLLAAYPSVDNWRTALTLFRDGSKLDEQQTLDVWRLQRAAGALKGERDFYDYAYLAVQRGLPGEAKAVLDEAIAAHAIDTKSVAIKELLTSSGGKVAADKAALPAVDARARAGADPKSAINTATAYFGYGQYDKAADLLRVALQKPGVDSDLANTRLGIALAMSQHKPEALQAFGSVTTGTRAQIANYWKIWVSGKS